MISLLSYAKIIALHKRYKMLNNLLFFNNERNKITKGKKRA
jgi:hypothetical protein